MGLLNEELHQKTCDFDEANTGFAFAASEASSPLPLFLPGADSDVESPGLFHLQEATPSFVGQARELKGLHEFVRIEDRAFHWGGILGPSGTGKSRLAVEFCQRIRKLGFTAGFLRAEHLSLLVDYQPQNPTLVVIDGVAANYKQVIEIIEHLYQRRHSNPLEKNFRLLLLDRNIYDSWWEYFRYNPQVSQSSVQRGVSLGIDRNFLGLGEKERWQILQEVYKQRKNEAIPYTSEEVLRELNRLDSNRTIQFAILVGLMLADGHYSNLTQWDRGQLLRYFLNHKKNDYWHMPEATTKETLGTYASLLVLTTITQGLPEETIKELCKETTGTGGGLPENPARSVYNRFATSRFDTKRGKYIWEGLPANIIGEFYVLDQFETWIR